MDRKEYKRQWYLKNVAKRDALLPPRTSKGKWTHSKYGYIMVQDPERGLTYEHIVLAEKALGRPLPKGVVVHHTIAPNDNHGPFKLIICPNQAYHQLLHRRAGDRINQYG